MSHRLLDYAKRARRRFCAGSHSKTPAELVLSGVRSLEEWVEVLHQERGRTDLKRRSETRASFPEDQRLS